MQNFTEFSLDEARMSAALRMANAIDKQRAKSDASRARTPSSIPKKEEPKKQGVAEGSKEGAYPKYSQGHNDAMNNKPSTHKTLTGNDRHNYVSGYKDGLIDRKKHHGVAEETIHEADKSSGHIATSQSSSFGGYRPRVVDKKTGKSIHTSVHVYKSETHAKNHAKAYLKAHNENGADAGYRAGQNYAKANIQHLHNIKEQGVAEASDRMQRYGQLILKRKAEQNAAAQAAKPQPKKEEPPASSDYDSMSTRDFMKQLRDQRRPKKKGVAEAFRPMDEPRYDLSIEARQKRADNAAKAKKEEPKKEVSEALDTHEIAMSHKDKASKALETSDMKSFHNHMSNHHESMGQWHESKGRHSAADREYAKGEEHHEKSLKPDNSRTVGAKNESAICIHCQSDPCICDDSHGFVSEAAQGHTIEAHGIRGMKGTAWRKTFKNHEHLSDWADKNDSVEVHATRDLEQAKKGNLSPAMKEEVLSEGANQHKVSVTVSEKDHPMVSKRLEKQQKRVIVSADSKEEAVVRAKKFYTKQGYHVHDAEYHSPQAKTSMKTESSVPSFNEFVSEMWHSGDAYNDAYKREFKRREMEHELGHEDRAEKESSNSSHAVHINGKKWKSFSTKSHAQNVANKIKGATVHKEEYVDENASLDKYKKYTRPVVKTTPKMERTTNPAGRTTDHVEWKVTTDTGEIVRHKSKKEAQAHFDSLPK